MITGAFVNGAILQVNTVVSVCLQALILNTEITET